MELLWTGARTRRKEDPWARPGPRVAALGPGPHVEAGSFATRSYADAQHDYRTFSAHFVELVYELTARSDACVVGRVTAESVEWNASRTVIVTRYTLDVSEELVGQSFPL